jgi:hypothetical protein
LIVRQPATKLTRPTDCWIVRIRSALIVPNDREHWMTALWAIECDIISKGIARYLLAIGVNTSEVRDLCHFIPLPLLVAHEVFQLLRELEEDQLLEYEQAFDD